MLKEIETAEEKHNLKEAFVKSEHSCCEFEECGVLLLCNIEFLLDHKVNHIVDNECKIRKEDIQYHLFSSMRPDIVDECSYSSLAENLLVISVSQAFN